MIDANPARPDPTPPRHPIPAPLLTPAAAFIVGILVSDALGPAPAPHWAWGLVALAPLALLLSPRATTPALALAALAVGFLRHQSEIRLPPDHIATLVASTPELARIEVRVATPPVLRPPAARNPYLPAPPDARVEFAADSVALLNSDAPAPIRGRIAVAVVSSEFDASPGDRLVLTGTLFRFQGPRNPGQRDYARFRSLAGVQVGLHVPSPRFAVRRPHAPVPLVQRFANSLRHAAQRALLQPYAGIDPEAAPLLNTIVLGQRSAVDRGLNDAFMRIGAVHILSVSGFHVGLLAALAWSLARRLLRAAPMPAALSTAAVLLAYALLAEQNAPILRATVMALFYCAARLRARPTPALNWLAASAITVLLLNPNDLFSAGFQLSFTQVFALIVVVPRLNRRLTGWTPRVPQHHLPAEPRTLPALLAHRLARSLTLAGAVAGVCWLAALPLTLHHFGLLTPYGPLQSLILMPLAAALVVLGFLQLLAAALPGVGQLTAPLLQLAAGLLIRTAHSLAAWPGTCLTLPQPPAWLVFTTCALPLVPLVLRSPAARSNPASRRADRPRSALALASFLLLPATWAGWWVVTHRPAPDRSLQLDLLDVGAGTAALLHLPSRDTFAFDLGTVENWDVGTLAAHALRAACARGLSAAFISHADLDHYSGLPSLLDAFPTRDVNVSPDFEHRWRSEQTRPLLRPPWAGAKLHTVRAGDRLDLQDNHWLEPGRSANPSADVLWPPQDLDDAWSDNDRSLVIRINAHGRTLLLTGDIERRAMEALLQRADSGTLNLHADLLVAPHHGAVLPLVTERFYAAVRPRWVLVSTDRPRPRLLDLVRRTLGGDCRLLSTHDSGALRVTIAADGSLSVAAPFAPTLTPAPLPAPDPP